MVHEIKKHLIQWNFDQTIVIEGGAVRHFKKREKTWCRTYPAQNSQIEKANIIFEDGGTVKNINYNEFRYVDDSEKDDAG